MSQLDAAKNWWMHNNAGADFPDDETIVARWREAVREEGDVAIKDGYVKLDVLGPPPRFSVWSLRTGAHPPMPITTADEMMIVECKTPGDLQVRAVIVLDPEDGIVIHCSGEIEIRSAPLDADENRKYF